MGIWTANICQRYDIRTPIDGIRGMVEISRHYAENAVDHLSAYEAGRWFILYENILFLLCKMLQKPALTYVVFSDIINR